MRDNRAFKIVICALFAALTCVATWLIKIPLPVVGYINLGDCIVLLAAYVLGPVYGAVAGAVGSALADVLAGYAAYAPATFIIKALMALVAGYMFKSFKKKNVAMLFGGIAAEVIMVVGYLVYEMFVLSYGTAAMASVAFNALQGVIGIVVSSVLYEVLKKSKVLNKIK